MSVWHLPGAAAGRESRGWPARYEIQVESVLHERWSAWFEGLRIEIVGDATVLSGSVPDVSALHAILDKVCDLGLTLISVRRIPPNEETPRNAE